MFRFLIRLAAAVVAAIGAGTLVLVFGGPLPVLAHISACITGAMIFGLILLVTAPEGSESGVR